MSGTTDAAIKLALNEEERAKRNRKAAKEAQATDDSPSGKTMESEEGGPIRESQVNMAQTKRAAKRKAGDIGDTDLVDDVRHVEEELEVEEEDGIRLEAFNLKDERQKGRFDESGNYVENEKEGDEDNDATDAWLASDEAKVVDARTRLRIEEQQRQLEAADAAAPLTAVQIARLQWQVAKILNVDETVTAALKRLGGQGHRVGKRAKKNAAAAEKAQKRDPLAKEKFDQLTEAVVALMDAGEGEVYSQDKGYFERCAAVYIDIDEDGDDGGLDNNKKGLNILAGGVGQAAYEDADEDMFAEDDVDGEGKGEKPGGDPVEKETATREQNEEAASLKSKEKEEEADATDYGSWPIKELRRFLQERGVDSNGIVEKAELVATVKAAAGKQRSASGGGAGVHAPSGYKFDPGSKMWISEESGMYWDASSGGFYNPADQKWYSYSAEGQWVEWK